MLINKKCVLLGWNSTSVPNDVNQLRPAISIKLVWHQLRNCSDNFCPSADSLVVYRQLCNYLSLWKANISIYKNQISPNIFHRALGYAKCPLSLHALEVSDFKYNLVWEFRNRGCWEFFNRIALQKKNAIFLSWECTTRSNISTGKGDCSGGGRPG